MHFGVWITTILLICFAGWQGYNLYQEHHDYRESRLLFDTEVCIESHGWGAKKAAIQALDIMAEIHRKLDKFSPSSEIYAVNCQAGVQPVIVSELTFKCIEEALRLARITDGAFDPTIGPLVNLWKFGEDGQKSIPCSQDITTNLKLVGYQKVMLNKETRTVYLTEKGMSLDLGAIAKGYAVDQAVKMLKEKNISSALVSAGGNIYALGKKDDYTPWRIGIRDPIHRGRIIGDVQLENQAIDTSGDYERFFWDDGQKYSHILDPRTGYPVQGVSGCTIVADSSTGADALATALFVLGAEKGLEVIEHENGIGLMITSAGKIILSKEMMKKICHNHFQDYLEVVF